MRENETDEEMDDSNSREDENFIKTGRYLWLDQYRGVIVLWFMIALILYPLSGDVAKSILPVGPTWLNHGFRISPSLYPSEGIDFPAIITAIDYGQGTLIFLIGFFQALSFDKRKDLLDERFAWNHVFYRVITFFAISLVIYDVILGWGWYESLFNGVVANIAWASLIGPIICKIKDIGVERVRIGLYLILLHFVLYSIPELKNWSTGVPFTSNYFEFPFRLMSFFAISAIGTGFARWWFDKDGFIQKEELKKHILPYSMAFFVLAYIVDFFQWANWNDSSAAMTFLSLGWATSTMFLAYAINDSGYVVKPLVIFGKNMFLSFLLAPLIAISFVYLFEDIARQSSLNGFILIGILPVAVLYFANWILHRKNIILKI